MTEHIHDERTEPVFGVIPSIDRSGYRYGRRVEDETDSLCSSLGPDGSHPSLSTAPTSQPHSSPSSSSWEKCDWTWDSPRHSPDTSWDAAFDPRASTETYASTVPDDEEVDEEEDDPEYAVPDLPLEHLRDEPIPCTPLEFAQLFRSTRRLHVAHDPTTEDGNLNLRVDAKVSASDGRRHDFTLFHLRMYDLKRREFSLRRYCRDSGREICHSSRKRATPTTATADWRPAIRRSVSSALASLRGRHEPKTSTVSGLHRRDSGYETDDPATPTRPRQLPLPSNTIKLEFSNYAQVEMKRRGTKGAKRYECEYWGRRYTWKRSMRREGSRLEISYHLVNDLGDVLAHIVPVPLTTAQARQEQETGGWVPPCSMWISDERILRGSADVAE